MSPDRWEDLRFTIIALGVCLILWGLFRGGGNR